MFDFVRENKKLVQIVLALIILPFAFWGVDSYNKSGGSSDVAATVNDIKITQREFESALRQQQDQMRKMLGANFDVAMLDNPEIKFGVIDNLVEQRLLIERAKAIGLTVNDEQIFQIIQGIGAFKDNGKFDKKRYEAALASQNLTPLAFESRLRGELTGLQMRDAYAKNGFAPHEVIDNIIHLNEQQRVVSTSQISLQPFMGQIKIDDATLKKYYEQNQTEFQVPEQAKVEYVKLSVDNLLAKAEVKAEDVRKYYDEHQSDFGKPEERETAHILIAAAAKEPQAVQDAAKAKAEKILQQVLKNPSEFASLAKLNSQDPGSAANGGSLGFFGRGMMVKPFEDAAFRLKPGEISGLVKSDFGYHIIKLIAVKPAKLLPFDEASLDITKKLRQLKAADLFAELAEKFSNAANDQGDTLKPAADLAGLKIEQSEWLIKGEAAGELWNAKMLQAIFSDDTIKNKRNTAAIEVATNTLVVARILEHKPSATRKMEEVQEIIRQKLMRQQALELAIKQGKTLLGQLQLGEKPAVNWNAAQTVNRVQHDSLDKEMLRKIFQADSTKLPQFVGSETAQNGYILVRIDAIKEGDKPDDKKRAAYEKKMRELIGEEMFRAYLSDAKKQATIKINLPAPTLQ